MSAVAFSQKVAAKFLKKSDWVLDHIVAQAILQKRFRHGLIVDRSASDVDENAFVAVNLALSRFVRFPTACSVAAPLQ